MKDTIFLLCSKVQGCEIYRLFGQLLLSQGSILPQWLLSLERKDGDTLLSDRAVNRPVCSDGGGHV